MSISSDRSSILRRVVRHSVAHRIERLLSLKPRDRDMALRGKWWRYWIIMDDFRLSRHGIMNRAVRHLISCNGRWRAIVLNLLSYGFFLSPRVYDGRFSAGGCFIAYDFERGNIFSGQMKTDDGQILNACSFSRKLVSHADSTLRYAKFHPFGFSVKSFPFLQFILLFLFILFYFECIWDKINYIFS